MSMNTSQFTYMCWVLEHDKLTPEHKDAHALSCELSVTVGKITVDQCALHLDAWMNEMYQLETMRG